MGRNSSAACLDCKKQYDIGHGSSGGWMDHHETLVSFDAAAAKDPAAASGVNSRRVRAFLVEHDGHRILWWSSDYAYIDNAGALRGDYDDDLIQEGIGQMQLFVGHEDGFVPVEQLADATRDVGARR